MTGMLAVAVLIAMATSPLLIDAGFSVVRRWARRRSWTGVPARSGSEPIRAVKRARVRVAPDGSAATLGGLTFGGTYAVEDDARCPRGCPRPEGGCDCGFYAVRPDTEEQVLGVLVRRPGSIASVRLEVELSGVVLEYDLGYRAEHQRVLCVTVPRRCAACARHDARGEAVALAPAPMLLWEPRVQTQTRRGGDATWPVLEPRCRRHLDRHPGDRLPIDVVAAGPAARPSAWMGPGAALTGPAIDLVELAGLLGTEVRWAALDAR